MSKLYNIIKLLENTSGTKAKQAILEQNKDNELLHTYLCLATDPSIRFFMTAKTFPKNIKKGCRASDLNKAELYDFAEVLFTREMSGKAAIEFIEGFCYFLSAEDTEIIRRMVLKNTKTKVGVTLINKVWPNSIFVLPYQRCSLPKEVDMSAIKWEDGVFSQEKSDGMYFDASRNAGGLARKSCGTIEVYTRSGTDFTKNVLGEQLWAIFSILPLHTHLQGEFIVIDEKDGSVLSRKKGNGMINSALENDEPLPTGFHIEARVWDFVMEGQEQFPYNVRFQQLLGMEFDGCFGNVIQVIDTKVVYSYNQAMAHFYRMRREGKEGTVIKLPDSPWIDGTSKGQIKMKSEVEVELRAKELVAGNSDGKHANTFGSIRFESECGKVLVDVSGFTDEERADIFTNWETKYKDMIATVCFSEIIDSRSKATYSLYLPRFIEWRFDKREADDLERIRTTLESANKGKNDGTSE